MQSALQGVPAGASILIVEDDPEQVRLYAKILRGHRLTILARASEALHHLDTASADLVILDHVLAGGESGLEFLPAFKELAAHVPVIVISGTLDVREQLAALQGPLAAHYVLEKPVQLEQFESVVAQSLTRCGLGEIVAQLKSIERMEKEAISEPERRYTDRLTRQHALLNHLREGAPDRSIAGLARRYQVDRKTIRRDLQELVRRGQLPASDLPEGAADP
jgi:DNA-binding NtrC family response regulator